MTKWKVPHKEPLKERKPYIVTIDTFALTLNHQKVPTTIKPNTDSWNSAWSLSSGFRFLWKFLCNLKRRGQFRFFRHMVVRADELRERQKNRKRVCSSLQDIGSVPSRTRKIFNR